MTNKVVLALAAALCVSLPLATHAEGDRPGRPDGATGRGGYGQGRDGQGGYGGHGGGHGNYGGDHNRWNNRPHYPAPPMRGSYHSPHWSYYNYHRWHAGYWQHGYHGSRLGWWWVVGPDWFYYPRVVVSVSHPQPAPPTVIVQPNAAPAAPAQTWYYCRAADEYYPHVSTCDNWEEVPATPNR